MKSKSGKLFFGAIWLVFFGMGFANAWDQFVRDHPGASGWDFLRAMAPLAVEPLLIILGLVILGGVLGKVAEKFSRWPGAPNSPPPPVDAGPLYAIRSYPIHVGVCLGLVAATLFLFFSWPTGAMVLVGLTIAAWVMLARRMGFEPTNDPAAPQNQPRT